MSAQVTGPFFLIACLPSAEVRAELARLHRRFQVVPGTQAQVDWGDEGSILVYVGMPKCTRNT